MLLNDRNISVFAWIGLLLLIPLFSIFNGLLLMSLWGWYIVPFGVMSITLPHAIGLSIIIGLFRTTIKSKDLGKTFLENALYIAVTFSFGWIVHLFM